MSYSWLPPLLAEIAGVVGLDAALRLAEKKGGGRITVPARAPDGHWLVELLGREAADKLCDHYREVGPEGVGRGRNLDLPVGPAGTLVAAQRDARRRVLAAIEGGMSAEEAARQAGVTRRTAYRAKKGKLEDPRQRRLF